ncbi:L,D-transpeptidase family protein [Candidatus Electronema sp. TJ]|uniref:L,D-transpeptidase family protein n=1 Tax=Candidatus Electronema sp. TJ TaxID=3401573 RepID=UPI003AA98A16
MTQSNGPSQCLSQPQGLPDIPPLDLSEIGDQLFWLLKSRPTARLHVSSMKGEPTQMDTLLTELYTDSGFAPYWVTEAGPADRTRIMQLLAALARTAEDGLTPARYPAADIAALLSTAKTTEELARLDLLLTLALSAYVTDMRKGQAASVGFDPALLAAVRGSGSDMSQVVKQGLRTVDLSHFLEMQPPQHKAYRALKRLLAEYRQIEAVGGWPHIPDGKKIEIGMTDSRLSLLVQRLLATGDLSKTEAAKPFLRHEGALVKALKQFQNRHNLEPDGIVGKITLAALNIPVQEQVSRIMLNLERWRWLPHQLAGRRILVNIAGFTLTVMLDTAEELSMPVIVGETHTKTPVFSQAMSYIEINPYWTVPSSIAWKEIVPKMKKDPGYLDRQRIRIFAGWSGSAPEIPPSAINWHTIGSGITRYRLRQEPGPSNALGSVKFVFPNRSSIYMHDTPGRSLFQQARRSLSHGCIRVSRPLDLALHLLQQDGQNISQERLQQAVASKKQQVFLLRKPVPVHLLYLTVLAAEDGTAHFYEDIYGNDTHLAESLHLSGGIEGICFSLPD